MCTDLEAYASQSNPIERDGNGKETKEANSKTISVSKSQQERKKSHSSESIKYNYVLVDVEFLFFASHRVFFGSRRGMDIIISTWIHGIDYLCNLVAIKDETRRVMRMD